MKILVTGARGMLGRTLMRRLPQEGHEVLGTDLPEVDLRQGRACDELLGRLKPQVVIHGAAMTAVDRCEAEEDEAFAVNALASTLLAAACHRHGAYLFAISTDYVFRGDLDRPYHEWDVPDPQTAYGRSKYAGERAVALHCPNHTILRIAWLYGPGGPSFVHTVMRVGAQKGEPLKVVDDQRGNPTSTDAVAGLLLRLVDHPIPGVVHGTCEGSCSWFQFSQALVTLGVLKREVTPCTTAEFPRPARRPANSRLDKRVLRLAGWPAMPSWQETLERFFREFPEG
jgi:dTDP-4-dehydrorhamnose reductase